MKITKNTVDTPIAALACTFLLYLFATISGCSSRFPPPEKFQNSITRDYRVRFEGQTIGQVSIVTSQAPDKVLTTETTTIATQFRGLNTINNVIREIHEEDSGGHPLSAQKQIIIPHAMRNSSASIINGELTIEEERGDQHARLTRQLPADFLLFQGIREKMRDSARKATPVFYSEWSFEQQHFVSVKLEASRPTGSEPANSWLIRKESQSNGKILVENYLVDNDFYPLKTPINYLGKRLFIERCLPPCSDEKRQALRPLDQQLLNSPYQITQDALAGHIRYQIHSATRPVTTGEQEVRRNGDAWIVDVCTECNKGAEQAPADLAQYLGPNTWMETQDARLITAAGRAVNLQDSADIRMTKLARLTRNRLAKNPQFSGYATALQAYQNRTGDCTEYALLLATLGRVAGVPTRVLFGLSYTREKFHGHKHVFAPHAWVQAWVDNRWRSYDAALENFDAGHIALNISDGNQQDFNAIFDNFTQLNIMSAQHIVKAKTNR